MHAGGRPEWLDQAQPDLIARAGNDGQETLTWAAAWAVGAAPLTTLAYRFFIGGQAVAASTWAFIPS